MLKLLVALIFCCSAFARAEDIGKIGNTYAIAERNLIEIFKARAQAKVADGTWQRLMDKQRDKMKDYAERPIGKKLPRALQYSVRYFDPTIELEQNISDAEGKILYPKGTKINPLDYREYKRTLCFFDGDDKRQVEWAKSYCLDPINARAILVNGPILDLSKQLDARLFFDQYGVLVRHFGIRAVPTVVRQSGRVFAIEEFEAGT